MMAVRQSKWTKYPTDEQILRQANKEYWNFPCPECGEGCTGWGALPVRKITCCMCGWEWKNPKVGVHQTLLEEFG